jgi:hypothetical protein
MKRAHLRDTATMTNKKREKREEIFCFKEGTGVFCSLKVLGQRKIKYLVLQVFIKKIFFLQLYIFSILAIKKLDPNQILIPQKA